MKTHNEKNRILVDNVGNVVKIGHCYEVLNWNYTSSGWASSLVTITFIDSIKGSKSFDKMNFANVEFMIDGEVHRRQIMDGVLRSIS